MTQIAAFPARVLTLANPVLIGNDVLLVQTRLAELGFPCADLPGATVPRRDGAVRADIAGTYAKRTAEAVRRYQDERGLKIDGVIGSNTWRALFGPPQPLRSAVPQAHVDPRKTDTDLRKLHPAMRQRVLALIARLQQDKVPMRLFETFRSPERQQYLIDKGSTGKTVTQAGAFRSFHQYGLAIDMVIDIPGQEWDNATAQGIAWFKAYRAAGLQAGLATGPDWDWPHLQFPDLSIRDLLNGKYPAGGDADWADNLTVAITRWRGERRPPLPEQVAPPERPALAAPPTALQDGAAIDWAGLPQVAALDWFHPFGGRPWRVDGRGIYLRGHAGGTQPLITEGTPDTCSAIVTCFGADIARASARHGLPAEILIMIIATETGFLRSQGFTGPRSFRWEPRPVDYSAGPMQILSATAREVNRSAKLGHDDKTFPALGKRPASAPTDLPLYRGDIALDVGAAFLGQMMRRHGANPMLLSAAYNAGGVYASQNSWGVRCHGDHLDRAAKWFGDACRLLRPGAA